MNDDEWEEILQRFNEEGLDTSLPDERKLLYVWRWLVDAETNCISLRHQLDKLGKKQAEELKEIRNCMEQMCNSWEAKVSDLEDQNQKFQEQLDLSDQGTSTMLSKDIRQMLVEEGLDNIVGFPIVQQFACLLDERASLKSQVDKEIERRRKCEQLARVVSNLPDCIKLGSSQIQRILDRQKDEYEEEIRNQQETMKHVKEQLKQVHEEELNRLNTEQERLISELGKASEKIQELVAHIGIEQGKDTSKIPWVQSILDGSYVKEMQDLRNDRDHFRNLYQEQQKQIRDQSENIRMLERTTKQLELDNDTLAYKLSESLAQIDDLEDQLRREAVRGKRESIFKQLSGKDANSMKNNLNKYLDNRPNYQEPLDEQVKKLQGESTKLQEQLESVEKQLELTTAKYQQHKERHRDKMFRLRDIQDKEQKEWKDQFEACQAELQFVRSMLGREQEWRLKMEADCRKLQTENQQLQNGIMEKEKSEREKAFDLSVLQREMEIVKASARNTLHSNGSPSRRNSVWPVLTHPKKW